MDAHQYGPSEYIVCMMKANQFCQYVICKLITFFNLINVKLFYITYYILLNETVLIYISTILIEQHECVMWRLTDKEWYAVHALRFSASDGNKGVAAADVTINLCNCSGHGECLFDLLADDYELRQTFRIVQCNCSTGWEGKE